MLVLTMEGISLTRLSSLEQIRLQGYEGKWNRKSCLAAEMHGHTS